MSLDGVCYGYRCEQNTEHLLTHDGTRWSLVYWSIYDGTHWSLVYWSSYDGTHWSLVIGLATMTHIGHWFIGLATMTHIGNWFIGLATMAHIGHWFIGLAGDTQCGTLASCQAMAECNVVIMVVRSSWWENEVIMHKGHCTALKHCPLSFHVTVLVSHVVLKCHQSCNDMLHLYLP